MYESKVTLFNGVVGSFGFVIYPGFPEIKLCVVPIEGLCVHRCFYYSF